jgi:hypothetical protein
MIFFDLLRCVLTYDIMGKQATLGGFVADSKWGDCAPNDDICVASDGSSVGDAVGGYIADFSFYYLIQQYSVGEGTRSGLRLHFLVFGCRDLACNIGASSQCPDPALFFPRCTCALADGYGVWDVNAGNFGSWVRETPIAPN